MTYNQETNDGGTTITLTFSGEEINTPGIAPFVLVQLAQAMQQSRISKKLTALAVLANSIEMTQLYKGPE